jgi:hypothetical protein
LEPNPVKSAARWVSREERERERERKRVDGERDNKDISEQSMSVMPQCDRCAPEE